MGANIRTGLRAFKARLQYGLRKTARILHVTNTLVMLTLVWFLVMVPTGLLMQLFRQTRLDRRGNPRCAVNRHWRGHPIGPDEMKRPF